MSEDNKHNLVYLESSSMRGLYENMENWQNVNHKRLLSASINRDGDVFCCIALTNPSEVILVYLTGEYNDYSPIRTSRNGGLQVKVEEKFPGL